MQSSHQQLVHVPTMLGPLLGRPMVMVMCAGRCVDDVEPAEEQQDRQGREGEAAHRLNVGLVEPLLYPSTG